MKVYVTDYAAEHEGKPHALDLVPYQFLRVFQANGRVIEIVPQDDHVKIRTPDDRLVIWPATSNTIEVEAVSYQEGPGRAGRSFQEANKRAELVAFLQVSLGNLVDGIEQLRSAFEKGAGKDHPYVATLNRYLDEARAGLEAIKA